MSSRLPARYGVLDKFNKPPTLRRFQYPPSCRGEAETKANDLNVIDGGRARYAPAAIFADGSVEEVR